MNKFVFAHVLARKSLITLVTVLIATLTITAPEANAAGNPTPKIVGTPTLGMTVTADPGVWPANTTLDYLWLADGQPLVRYVNGDEFTFTTNTFDSFE